MMTEKETMDSVTDTEQRAADTTPPSSDPQPTPSHEADPQPSGDSSDPAVEKTEATPAELEEKLKSVERQAQENHDRFRALDSSGAYGEPDGLAEGIEMTLRELLKIFDKFGVRPIASLQQPFDPNLHEAVMQEPSDAVPANTVIKELQKGYMLHDRLLRPAMVVVSKESA